jgi:hypothetical protein
MLPSFCLKEADLLKLDPEFFDGAPVVETSLALELLVMTPGGLLSNNSAL